MDLLREPESTDNPLPTLLSALRAGGIVYRLGGTDRESVLQNLVEVLRLPDEVDREFLYQVLLARESLGSTAIGDGLAIPHVRNPVVLHVAQPSITLCFLEHPIEFGALDSRPVHTLFTLISPTVRSHLHMLSRLMFFLRDPQARAVLQRQGSREEILGEVERMDAHLQPANAPA